jgi:Ankyrin repeats (3 copies)
MAIRYAAESGYTSVVKKLLKDPRGRAEPCGPKAVDPSVNDQEPIRWATAGGHLNVVKRLLKDPRVDLTKAIKKAAKDGHLEVVEELMKHLKGKKKN